MKNMMNFSGKIILSAAIIGILFTIKAFALTEQVQAMKELEKQVAIKPPTVVITRPTVQYTADKFKNPFEGFTGEAIARPEEVALPNIVVQGVITGGSFPQAIINGKVVKIGDTVIEGIKIVNIEKNGITIFYGDKQVKIAAPGVAAIPKKTQEKPQGGQK